MNKVRYILLLCLLSCSAWVSAQTFGDIRRSSFWQDSRNVAGIRQDSLSRSYTEVYGQYEEGDFRDTWQASRKWSAGAVTESILHFDRMSLTGSFSFDQTEGYGMCGSMFIKPGYFPIDVLEFTPGRKTLQTYAFDGGIAYSVNDSWTIGARMDFESSNLAKMKDLRHANSRLDMTVVPGLMFRCGGWALGFSPLFRKVSETIDAEQVGTAESSYYAFLDKGLMYGVRQVWTGSGVHLQESGVNGLPVREYSYGAAVQARYGNIYADFELLRTSGAAGEKEYIWFEFPGISMDADIRYRWVRDSEENNLRLHFDWKRQDMDENVLEKISHNGVTTVLDHGSNRIFSRSSVNLSPEYEHIHKVMEFRAGLSFTLNNGISSQVYPYICTQTLTDASVYAELVFHHGRFDWGVKGMYLKGWVSETDRLASGDTGVQSAPYRLQDWYELHMEYMTAARFCSDLMVRYNFRNGMYVGADLESVKAFDLKVMTGSDRFSASLKLGYDF